MFMGGVEQYALAYSRKGWATFSLVPNDKIPFPGSCGVKDATTEPQTWPPDCNLAIATGKVSGLVVVDVDTDKGQRSLYSFFAEHTRFHDTVICLTPRGQHIYFRYPSEHVGCKVNMAPGIDIRATGGYVVAPPSTRNTGIYRWHPRAAPGMLPLAPMPAWLIGMLRPEVRAAPIVHQGRQCGINGRAIIDGERNQTLFKICCSLIKDGHSDIMGKMLAINEARCQPPVPEEEVRYLVGMAVGRYSG